MPSGNFNGNTTGITIYSLMKLFTFWFNVFYYYSTNTQPLIFASYVIISFLGIVLKLYLNVISTDFLPDSYYRILMLFCIIISSGLMADHGFAGNYPE